MKPDLFNQIQNRVYRDYHRHITRRPTPEDVNAFLRAARVRLYLMTTINKGRTVEFIRHLERKLDLPMGVIDREIQFGLRILRGDELFRRTLCRDRDTPEKVWTDLRCYDPNPQSLPHLLDRSVSPVNVERR